MQYELTVKSTVDERYDGHIEEAVTEIIGELVTYSEGGCGGSDPLPADNHYGLATADETEARNAAVKVAKALERPVTYYLFGDGVDPETTARFTAQPTDSEV